jgi:tRNA-specific 2-thiouridylase
MDGQYLGDHRGVIHYTIGQRRGLGIGGLADPLYVVKLDPTRRRVIVGPKDALSTRRSRCARSTGWATRPFDSRPNGICLGQDPLHPPAARRVLRPLSPPRQRSN